MDVMRSMPDNSIDAIITDPPYGLSFMGAKWDSFGGSTGRETVEERQRKSKEYAKRNNGAPRCGNSHKHAPKDGEMAAFQAAMTPVFEEALRVAKPGAHLLCFGGTRTFHRMACAIEDAGWEVRDCVMWVYGSGFPKSMDVSKAIDKALGAEREKVRVPANEVRNPKSINSGHGVEGGDRPWMKKALEVGYHEKDGNVPATDVAARWYGWGTCLKPAWEPIIVARKPLDGTVAHNVLTWGVGALNIDACRVPTDETVENHSRSADAAKSKGKYGNSSAQETHQTNGQKLGRFPANLVHDGSQMVLDLFPQSNGQQGKVAGTEPSRTGDNGIYGHYGPRNEFVPRNDSGSAARFFNELRDGEESADRTYTDRGGTNFAAKPGKRREPTSADRFFYCAKASKKDRGEGNNHPTVKPQALMEWLVKLVTPEGGVVLDPFMGSGTTGVACANLGAASSASSANGSTCRLRGRGCRGASANAESWNSPIYGTLDRIAALRGGFFRFRWRKTIFPLHRRLQLSHKWDIKTMKDHANRQTGALWGSLR